MARTGLDQNALIDMFASASTAHARFIEAPLVRRPHANRWLTAAYVTALKKSAWRP